MPFATVVALVTGHEQWAKQSIMELGVGHRGMDLPAD
jgi:hypothetical protein